MDIEIKENTLLSSLDVKDENSRKKRNRIHRRDNNRLAYNGKQFIGAIKFFDHVKDFGFIASNNCGMPDRKDSIQDFYVDSESFTEKNANAEKQIVVFQILKQTNGQEKAINVRRITKSDEDIQLVLSYYDEFEVRDKDYNRINLFSICNPPRKLVIEKVVSIIKDDMNRCPDVTFNHFEFFIRHYEKEGISIHNRYVFDRDYNKDERQIWKDFFSIFNNDELIEILKSFPSVCRYVSSETILNKWIDNLDFGQAENYLTKLQDQSKKTHYGRYEIQFPELRDFNTIAKLLPSKNIQETYLSKFHLLIDDIASKAIKTKLEVNDNNIRLQQFIDFLLRLTPNQHEDEIIYVKNELARRDFYNAVRSFLQEQKEYQASNVLYYYGKIDKKYRIEFVEKIKPDVSLYVDKYLEEKKLSACVSALSLFTFLDEDFRQSYLNRLYTILKDKFCSEVQAAINNNSGLPYSFEINYRKLTTLFDESTKTKLRSEIIKLMRCANNIVLISNCSVESTEKNERWLSTEEACQLAKPILEKWKYEDFNDFFNRNFNRRDYCTKLYTQTSDLGGLIATYAFNLIKPFKLSDNFDGSPVDDVQKIESIKAKNILFLKHLKSLLSNNTFAIWQEYINERNDTDLWTLYENKLISSLPPSIIEDVVYRLSLNDVLTKYTRWYNKPALANDNIKQILTDAGDDLFIAITSRLSNMDLTGENVPLAIFLTELMDLNKPSDLTQKISKFNDTLADNPKLSVILWAVFFKSKVPIKTNPNVLSEMFFLFPPYVQINVVKKLFAYIGQGHLCHTAESLYNALGGEQHQLCFPVEIVFAYLKLREQNPDERKENTIIDNVLLKLLSNRDDHPEWIGIRKFMTECYGRVEMIHGTQSRFNGSIRFIGNNKMEIYNPVRMISIDERNGVTHLQYDNEHFKKVDEWIGITFADNNYQKSGNQNDAFIYVFETGFEKELYPLARDFNFSYRTFYNFRENTTEDGYDENPFCECRMANNLAYNVNLPFYWCSNRQCFRKPARFHTTIEWEDYTILDFMRILNLPVDYTDNNGNPVRFGHYIKFSSYLRRFKWFYDHLKCRHCGELMHPHQVGNFLAYAVTEFSCANEECQGHNQVVYLNHCFNKPHCYSIIDSRDSKQCPNDQYICPECGACCSTENTRKHISNLRITGGYISPRLIYFVENNLGHWEKNQYFCYRCGHEMQPIQNDENNSYRYYRCNNCNYTLTPKPSPMAS